MTGLREGEEKPFSIDMDAQTTTVHGYRVFALIARV
jgi:hypothetical protein